MDRHTLLPSILVELRNLHKQAASQAVQENRFDVSNSNWLAWCDVQRARRNAEESLAALSREVSIEHLNIMT